MLGEAAAPLLPLIEPLLTAEYEWPRLAAAQAQLRITGSADRAVPVLTALVGPTPVGVRALQALAAVGHAPEELRPILTTFADSPRRLLPDSPFSGEDHFDEELRRLARALLAVRPQPDGL